MYASRPIGSIHRVYARGQEMQVGHGIHPTEK
jgi:hypothetical protein